MDNAFGIQVIREQPSTNASQSGTTIVGRGAGPVAALTVVRGEGARPVTVDVSGGRPVEAPDPIPGPVPDTVPSPEDPTPAAPRPATKKRLVVLSSPIMGKHRVRVDDVVVAKRLIILVFVDDGLSTIVEPPEHTDPGVPLMVEVDGRVYKCGYFEDFTAEFTRAGPGTLLVVLTRLPE